MLKVKIHTNIQRLYQFTHTHLHIDKKKYKTDRKNSYLHSLFTAVLNRRQI